MRDFLGTNWKTILAILILAAIAALTLGPVRAATDLPARLRQHVRAIASAEHNTATPAQLEQAALYIEATLRAEGYQVRRQEYIFAGQRVRNLEVSVANLGASAGPGRIFIVGAHYDSALAAPGANDNGSGVAAVLELARMLKGMRPAAGTEVKFVFFVNEEAPYFMGEGMGSLRHARALHRDGQQVEAALILETIGYYSQEKGSQRLPPGLERQYPDTGNFLAFVGTLDSSALVWRTLAEFRAASTFPSEGLAAPAWVEGVTLSDHCAYNRFGYPALMITDTAFMRYPHYHTAQDTPDKVDYPSVARIVEGLAKTIESMTG